MNIRIVLFLLLALIYGSCSHNSSDSKTEDEHDHDHEDSVEHEESENHKFQITAYSQNFELFAEADVFLVGEESNILSHFSNVPDFTALEEGIITLRLIIADSETQQTLDKPSRKGIYSFNLIPKKEGTGKLVYEIKTDSGEFTINVPNITVFHCEHDAEDISIELSKTNTSVFTKEQSWKIDFATELPKQEAFGQIIKTTAQIQSAQDDEILVTAKTNGVVIFSAENVLEGRSVSNGQTLFSISGSSLANENSAVRFAEAKNNNEKTKLDYERLQELAKDKIVSDKELISAKNEYDNAKAIFDNLNKNFSVSGQRISSPISGYVKQLFVKNGQYVESGQSIVSISKNKTLLLQAEVQQKYAPILGNINSANIRTIYDNKTYTLEELNGKFVSFGKSTNNDNYLIPVSLEIDNKGSFISGGFVELYLKTLSNNQALTLPNSAFLEEQGNFFVFVQINPELFEKRQVKLGSTDGLRTEIISGIDKDERVVTKGAIFIKLSQSTGALDAHSGHVH